MQMLGQGAALLQEWQATPGHESEELGAVIKLAK